MKDEFKVLGAMALLILAGAATLIYSQSFVSDDVPPPPDRGIRGPGPGRGPGPDILDRLDLSAQQKEQIGALHVAARDASKEYETKLRAADEQLRMMMESGSFDADKATPLVRAKADAMAQIELIRLSTDAASQKLLTSDQKAQLAQLANARPSFPPGRGFERPQQ